MVIRELSCEEEEEAMDYVLKHITHNDEPLDPEIVEGLAYVILSSLSGMGLKLVEGKCLGYLQHNAKLKVGDAH